MCITKDGQKLNVNADTAATAVAQALQAEKLVYLSDVNGVRRDKNDPESLLDSLTADQARELIASGAIECGHDPQGAGLPGDAGARRPQDSHHRRPPAAFLAAGSVHQQGRGHGNPSNGKADARRPFGDDPQAQ